ncbi:MAG: cobalamin-dependent protein [Deltaproteobacteria bacterium]|nr:cobalamin-dependent protein [Deltaproteobacteria bacterium]
MKKSSLKPPSPESSPREQNFQTTRAILLTAALQGQQDEVHAILGSALKKNSAKEIYLQVLVPTLQSLGTAWAKGEISIAQEHVATEAISSELSALRCTLAEAPANGHSALFAALPGDLHTLGPRMVADFFIMDGWKVSFLGNNTPASEIVSFAREHRVEVVGISVSSATHLKEVGELIAKLRRLPHAPKILLGGRAAAEFQKRSSSPQADAYPADAQQALTEARRLVGRTAAAQTLEEVARQIGARIRSERSKQSLSQAELSRQARLDRAYVSGLENGKHNATIGVLVQVASALGLSVQELLSGSATM